MEIIVKNVLNLCTMLRPVFYKSIFIAVFILFNNSITAQKADLTPKEIAHPKATPITPPENVKTTASVKN